jgi:hypothetical protein
MAERYSCERCGETHHEDNIDSCKACKRLVCPRCAGYVKQPDGTEKWMCDKCAKAKGLVPQS